MPDNVNTVTMAKLFTSQGYHDKAAEVYRYLLEKEPERRDLQDALAAVEAKTAVADPSSEQRLGELIGQWIELVIRYNRLKHLKKIQEKLA